MSNGVLVYVEHKDNTIAKASREALGQGKRCAEAMGASLSAVIVGSDPAGLAADVGRAGADRVYLVSDPCLGSVTIDGHGRAVAAAVEQASPSLVLFAATMEGKDIAPYVASTFDVGLATDCVEISADGEAIQAKRPVYAGKTYATIRSTATPFVASLRPNVFSPADGSDAPESVNVALPGEPSRVQIKDTAAAGADRVSLAEASVVVSGGRGLKGPENFHLVESLADAFGAAVGASRAVVDAGWRPHEEQVGQTGKTVSPQLYVACGISGAIQHLAGMSTSETIVAINQDPEAPIFNVATYGIVGDALEILPKLTEAVKAAKG